MAINFINMNKVLVEVMQINYDYRTLDYDIVSLSVSYIYLK